MNPRCPPLNDHVTRSMKSNKRKDTKPELLFRKELRKAGFPGYRLQWKVPGRPDICYPGRKIAIFINGCFWHRCPICNPNVPIHNRDFWEEKFQNNVNRDRNNTEKLKEMGWTVLIVWECELKKQTIESTIKKVTDVLEKTRFEQRQLT